MAEKGVRIRLKFQDPGILSKQQLDQGLAQCWHFLRFDDVRTIEELASDIVSVYNLGGSCPAGLGLEVDEFVLPASQPAHLLQDSDIVRIRRKKDQALAPGNQVPKDVRNEQLGIINGYRFPGYGGLELRALDEFEKETGGYKSEEEEGEMETDISLDGGARIEGDPGVTPIFSKELERGSTKRKRAKDPGTESGKKRRNSGNGPILGIEFANKVSRITGVDLRALDEFEGELGGYQSEQEEDETEEETDFSLGGTKNVVQFQAQPLGIIREEKRSAKKHKNSKKDNVEIPNEDRKQLQSSILDFGKEHMESSKKSKKRSSDATAGRRTEGALEVTPVKGKGKKTLKRVEKAETVRSKGEIVDIPPKSSRKSGLKGEQGKVESARGKSLGEEKWMDMEDTLMDSDSPADQQRCVDVAGATISGTPIIEDDPHKPSRSARRKKAKRKWLREQQAKMAVQMADLPLVVTDTCGNKAPLSTEEAVVKKKSNVAGMVEVETEEEVLPVVVRTGHIRFEPYDEDHPGHPTQSSPLLLNLGEHLKSKRQGQNWGQEKIAVKQRGKRWTQDSEDVVSQEDNGKNLKRRRKERVHHVNLENLPSFQGTPQEGDVLAYRLVELTTSWTPELSPCRVGVVVSVGPKTDMIKLAPHPDYPFSAMGAEDLDDEFGEGTEYCLPYDEDGFLETLLSSLVDLRLVEKNLGPKCAKLPEEGARQSVESKQCAALDGSASVPLMPGTNKRMEISELSNEKHGADEAVIEEDVVTLEEKSSAEHTDPENSGATKTAAASSPDWQTLLTKELQRKKKEIRQKSAEAGGIRKSGVVKVAPSARGRKSKYLRSAGVGSIVALLRAQQAL